MRLGVRAHDFGKLPLEELARRIAGHGLTCVQLAPVKAIAGCDADAGRLSPGFAVEVREAFRRHGIEIAVLGCYINLADPDAARRRPQLERFKEYLRCARDFGCSVVGTETGSLNPDFSWHPDNRGEAAYQTVLGAVRELAAEAEKFGVFVGIEGVERYVIDSPARLQRLVADVASPNVRVILDPVNLLSPANASAPETLVDEMFARLGERIVVVHAKDFVVTEGRLQELPAGEGRFPYPHFFRRLREHKPHLQVLLENTAPATIGATVDFMQRTWRATTVA